VAEERIVVVDYDPVWPRIFEALRERVRAALGGLAVAVEHVGSTAVPGLGAKPIIDLDVVVAATDVPEAIRRLAGIGYKHQGDLGISGRDAFEPPPDAPPHHLYLCPPDGAELRRHLLFRDYLRTHPEAAREYEALKRSLTERLAGDREAYTEAKTGFIARILEQADALAR
jgi:GrpB-like predicted nucleotidyltransferase (UPF0157 family)